MALPNDVKDREFKKFVEDDSGEVAVRTLISAGDIQIGAVEIKDHDSEDRVDVDWDGTYNALAVIDSRIKTDVDDNAIAHSQVLPVDVPLNYGYDDTNGYWSRFIVDEDNDAIPDGQSPQLVNSLMQYYDDKSSCWKRWRGDSGSIYTMVIGLYTPSFDSMCDDTSDALKVIGQVTPTDDYTTTNKGLDAVSSNMVYDGSKWDMMRGDSTNGVLVNLGSNNDVTVTALTDKSQFTKITDGTNTIGSTLDVSGEYHLNTAIIQSITTSSNNSTTDNLAAGATFTGTAETTYGINGIQIYHFADQDCTIYIDQSLDGTNWDLSDSFNCLANEACSRTFISVAPYFRARVTNTGSSATTEMRFATGMTPVINPLPRALDDYGRLITNTAIQDAETLTRAEVEPLGALKSFTPIRLVGTTFADSTKDTNFWTETVTGTGSVTQAGQVTLATGTTANSTVKYVSVRKARKVTGATNEFKCVAALTTDAEADNLRRIGCYDANNGFFFQVNGTTFSVGSRYSTADTLVNNGSFNGNWGPTFTPATNTLYRMTIDYTAISAKFFMNGKLLHTISSGAATPSTLTLNLPVTMENNNSNGNDTNNSFVVRLATILRLGEIKTSPQYYYFAAGQTAGITLKYGSGIIRKLIINSNSNNCAITLADSTTGATPAIFVTSGLTSRTDPNEIDFAEVPFSNGLRLIVSTANASVTVIYE